MSETFKSVGEMMSYFTNEEMIQERFSERLMANQNNLIVEHGVQLDGNLWWKLYANLLTIMLRITKHGFPNTSNTMQYVVGFTSICLSIKF
jgi:hypothetical protein